VRSSVEAVFVLSVALAEHASFPTGKRRLRAMLLPPLGKYGETSLVAAFSRRLDGFIAT
jgi:hypothetical protein